MKMPDGSEKLFRVSFWLRIGKCEPDRFIVDRVFDSYDEAYDFTVSVDSELKIPRREWNIEVMYRSKEEKK